MTTTAVEQVPSTLSVTKEVVIEASPEIVFECVLEEMGPGSELPDGTPFPMKVEPWPGGRWYRDLGNNAGHLWGHVQVIKPPTLLEVCGPMFMSYPAVSHVQYRLTPTGAGTTLKIVHRALGLIPPEHREGVSSGWEHGLTRIRELAAARAARR